MTYYISVCIFYLRFRFTFTPNPISEAETYPHTDNHKLFQRYEKATLYGRHAMCSGGM